MNDHHDPNPLAMTHEFDEGGVSHEPGTGLDQGPLKGDNPDMFSASSSITGYEMRVELARYRLDVEKLRTALHAFTGSVDVKHGKLSREMDTKLADFIREVDAKFADFTRGMDTKFADFTRELDAKFADFTREVDAKFADFTREMDTKFGDLRSELDAKFAEVHGEIAKLRRDMDVKFEKFSGEFRTELQRALRVQAAYIIGTLVALSALVATAIGLLS